MNKPVKVMKFGGTSVGAPERLARVVEIVTAATRTHRAVVIASAANGVTDRLVAAWDSLLAGTFQPAELLAYLRERYTDLAAASLTSASVQAYAAELEADLREVEALLNRLLAQADEAGRDALLAVGERLSVPLVALAIRDAGTDAAPVDAAPLVATDDAFGSAVVDLAETQRRLRRWFATVPAEQVPVITGFIGSTPQGETTTLGRGGSDYSAALVASALNADVMERWTDTDGVYTDDPRKNKEAKRLDSIVLEEAWAWNHAGKLGMHRKALDPLVEAGIPVHVRCTATPDQPGTLIVPAGRADVHSAVAL